MPERKVPLWHRDSLYIDVTLKDSGELEFAGQDLRGSEYEYWLTVSPADIPLIVAALGGELGTDVLELLRANAEAIVRQGEKTWLNSLGITPEFFSHGNW